MTVAVCKQSLQRFASEDDVAGQLLHQDGKVDEVGGGICEEFGYIVLNITLLNVNWHLSLFP